MRDWNFGFGVSYLNQGTLLFYDVFAILIGCWSFELHVNKLIIGRTAWGCDCEDIVGWGLLIDFEFFLLGRGLVVRFVCLRLSKYLRELSACKSLFH